MVILEASTDSRHKDKCTEDQKKRRQKKTFQSSNQLSWELKPSLLQPQKPKVSLKVKLEEVTYKAKASKTGKMTLGQKLAETSGQLFNYYIL